MNILYVSVHPVLEFDQIDMFESLGHQVFSLGFYTVRTSPDNLRPALNRTDWHDRCAALFSSTGCERRVDEASWTVSSEFCNAFDIVLVDHNYKFIATNWSAIRHKSVVWRTIGQELSWAESAMRPYREEGVKIVRWSSEESEITGYIGADLVIRASKRPEDWAGWAGSIGRVATFNNNFKARRDAMNLDFYERSLSGIPSDLYGLGNSDIENWRGLLTYQQQKEVLRSHQVAFVTGTFPAPYTLGFIEAWMTGIPVVHIGRTAFSRGVTGCFEIDKLIKNGENGYVVETVEEARMVTLDLLADAEHRSAVSKAGRTSAIENFGFNRGANEWNNFLRQIWSS